MSDKGPESMSPEAGTNGFAVGVNLTGSGRYSPPLEVKGNIISTVINCG